jgi:hypothetical protein
MPRLRKGKRRKQRKKMVVPVRVKLVGSDSPPEMACTLDASESGVKLAGYHGECKPEDVIEIHRGHRRAQFRVVWVKDLPNSSEKQLGAACVQPDKNIWDEKFPQRPDEYEDQEL